MKLRLEDAPPSALRRGLDAAGDIDVCDVLVSAGILRQHTSSKNVPIRCPYGEELHSNGDRNPSCSVSTETGAWNCFGCGNKGNLRHLLQAFKIPEAQIRLHLREGNKPSPPEKQAYRTVEEYARAKRLREDFLRDLGLEDDIVSGKPAIRIPYRDENGVELFSRHRPGHHGERFFQPAGVQTVLYGLDRLSDAQDAGYVILVEGESDAQTLWFHKLPALGMPGKAWKPEFTTTLDGIARIYFIREPDNNDLTALTSELGDRLKIIELPRAKDVSDLYVQHPLAFPERFEDAKAASRPGAGFVAASQLVSSRAQTPTVIWRSAADLRDYDPTPLKYYARFVPEDGQVLFIGDVKSGKTTLLTSLAYRLVNGFDFLNQPTTQTPVVYLTEQGLKMFRKQVPAPLLDAGENFHVLSYVENSLLTWPQFMEAGIQKCQAVDAKVMIVDTAGKFARLEGDSGNGDGFVREVLTHVTKAQNAGIAVILSKHERKSGGGITKAPSGSHAWTAEADLLVRITKGEGLESAQRKLHVEGRDPNVLGEWIIERDTLHNTYKLLGDFKQTQETSTIKKIDQLVKPGETIDLNALYDQLDATTDPHKTSIRTALHKCDRYTRTDRGQYHRDS